MKVMFATPCYISAVSMNYVTSLFSPTYQCAQFGLDCMLHLGLIALPVGHHGAIAVIGTLHPDGTRGAYQMGPIPYFA